MLEMQAAVYGFSQAPETRPALFEQLELASCLNHQLGDIRNTEQVQGWLRQANRMSYTWLLSHWFAAPQRILRTGRPMYGMLNVLEAVKTGQALCGGGRHYR